VGCFGNTLVVFKNTSGHNDSTEQWYHIVRHRALFQNVDLYNDIFKIFIGKSS
jgi:hypothetical protein